jgi:hypothetical protein
MSTTKREAAKSDNNERRVTLPNNGTQNANLLGNMDWLQMNPFGSQANQPSFMNKPTALQTRPNSPGQQAAPSSSQQGDSWQAMVGAGINAISTLAAAEEKTQRQKIILEQHKTNLEIAKQIGRNQEQAGKDTLKMQTEQHAYEAGENEKNRVLKREGMAQKKEIATQQIGIEKSKLEIEKDKLDFSMQQLISKEKRHHAQIESEERRHDKQLDHQMQIRTMELQAQVMASAANNSTSNPSSAPKKDDSVLQSADKAYKKGKKAFEKNETRDALRFFSQAKSLYQNANNDPEAQKRVAKIDGFTAALKV